MSLRKLRAQIEAYPISETKLPDDRNAPSAKLPIAELRHPVHTSGTPDMPFAQAPWLIRNARWVIFSAAVLALAALTYGYFYVQSTFGPDPLDSVLADAVKRGVITGATEDARVGPTLEPLPAAKNTDPVLQPLAHAIGAAPIVPMAPNPNAAITRSPRAATSAANEPPGARPRAVLDREQGRSRPCVAAVAALGLCEP